MENVSLTTKIKQEVLYLVLALIIATIIFKIAFHKEKIIPVIKTTLGIFWLFVLPGFFILYYWQDKLDFIERLIIGFVLSSAIIGISSYYAGLLGLHIKYHGIILPFILIIVGIVLMLAKKAE